MRVLTLEAFCARSLGNSSIENVISASVDHPATFQHLTVKQTLLDMRRDIMNRAIPLHERCTQSIGVNRFIRAIWMMCICFLVQGCFLSKEAVFDTSVSVFPFAAGQYKVEKFSEGLWKTENPMTVEISNDFYKISGDGNVSTTANFYELDRDLYVLDYGLRSEHSYALVRVKDGAILIYGPDCSGFLETPAAEQYPPKEKVSGGYISTCYFDDNEKLFSALRSYANSAQLVYRLTPVPVANAKTSPSTDQSNRIETIATTLCNTSSVNAAAILYHQHPYDAKKRMLSGWFSIPPGKCTEAGMFPKADLAVFAAGQAEQRGHQWAGDTAYACVSPRQTYRVVRVGEQCIAGEARKGFFRINTSRDSAKFTFQ
ncbi:MAG: DUF1036 domain-containing protein [Afipia sp.]|nr:DUF1036 domain-containing protein [Afipia sp.]